MLMLFFQSVLFSLLILIPIMVQPLSLGLIVMFVSIILSGMVGFMFISWFGFLLFLIYVGGLLVMFAYVVVLMPNNYFFSKNVLSYFLLSFLMISFISFCSYNYMFITESFITIQDSAQLLVSDYSCVVFLFLALVLFFALLVVVKICYFHGGPLRPFQM
uniref:NADH dehydrogenase subunit 6 n=1 Tax=Cephalothrix rufifrons TaxID=166042 RepID=A1YWC0_9BILA|nr:NADH dehydrogenase subunit 6 [Cephalothrix rufifrons]